jgi:hypothetical protein
VSKPDARQIFSTRTEPHDARKAQFENQRIAEESKISIDNLADQLTTNQTLQGDMIQENKIAHSTQSQSLAELKSIAKSSSQALVATAPQLTEIRKHLQK